MYSTPPEPPPLSPMGGRGGQGNFVPLSMLQHINKMSFIIGAPFSLSFSKLSLNELPLEMKFEPSCFGDFGAISTKGEKLLNWTVILVLFRGAQEGKEVARIFCTDMLKNSVSIAKCILDQSESPVISSWNSNNFSWFSKGFFQCRCEAFWELKVGSNISLFEYLLTITRAWFLFRILFPKL